MQWGINRKILLFVAAFTAAGGAVQTAQAFDACEPFRLDWISGGPFNPVPRGQSDPDICGGLIPSERLTCLSRHEGDGHQHKYVPSHDQGSYGDCTYQCVAGYLNYRSSMQGKAPNACPEFLASKKCDSLLPDRTHNILDAVGTFNDKGSCDRGDLGELLNTGPVHEALTEAVKDAIVSGFGRHDEELVCRAVTASTNDRQTRQLADELSRIIRHMDNARETAKFAGWMSDSALSSVPDGRRDEYFTCRAEEELFEPLCRGHIVKAQKATALGSHEVQAPDGAPDKLKQLNALVDGMESNPHPIEIRLRDAQVLLHDKPDPKGPPGIGHAVLLIGRQKIGDQCGFWIRNSWGTECPATKPSIHCDPARPGNVWISADALSGGDGFTHYLDMAEK